MMQLTQVPCTCRLRVQGRPARTSMDQHDASWLPHMAAIHGSSRCRDMSVFVKLGICRTSDVVRMCVSHDFTTFQSDFQRFSGEGLPFFGGSVDRRGKAARGRGCRSQAPRTWKDYGVAARIEKERCSKYSKDSKK